MKDCISYTGKPLQYYLDKCRFYKGERTAPHWVQVVDMALFWDYEQLWVMKHFASASNEIALAECFFKQHIGSYKAHGLGGFNKTDGVPISLKALLFNRYDHHVSGGADEFKQWYLSCYYAITKEKFDAAVRCCRYYKGDDVERKDEKEIIRFYEKCWVGTMLEYGEEHYAEYISDLKVVGLGNFEKNDGVPLSLKALLFNRYAKTSYSMKSAVEPFKEWYLNNYMERPK